MSYIFLIGSIGVWIKHCVDDQAKNVGVEAGARVEVRQISVVPGHRAQAEGILFPSMLQGGLWRADLLVEVAPPTFANHHHHHPNFDDRDAGKRVYDVAMQRDPIGWTMDRLRNLDDLLAECHAPDAIKDYDRADLANALPLMEAALRECYYRRPFEEIAQLLAAADEFGRDTANAMPNEQTGS